jgi:hypothetical protein
VVRGFLTAILRVQPPLTRITSQLRGPTRDLGHIGQLKAAGSTRRRLAEITRKRPAITAPPRDDSVKLAWVLAQPEPLTVRLRRSSFTLASEVVAVHPGDEGDGISFGNCSHSPMLAVAKSPRPSSGLTIATRRARSG